jgi:hypothetical protein
MKGLSGLGFRKEHFSEETQRKLMKEITTGWKDMRNDGRTMALLGSAKHLFRLFLFCSFHAFRLLVSDEWVGNGRSSPPRISIKWKWKSANIWLIVMVNL